MPSATATQTRDLIAVNLRQARRNMGVTQVQVAAATGATQDQVSRWERGTVSPSQDWTQPLADYFFDGDLSALYRVPSD